MRPGDQVVTTPFSFFASASAIVRAGARPVFADIDPQTFNLDPAQVRSFLRSSPHDKLRALLPVHLYGQCADMDEFQKLADEFRVSLLEDAAQAIGAQWGNQPNKARSAGSLGVAPAFSFYPTQKSQRLRRCRAGDDQQSQDGGALRVLRNHGSPRRYLHEELGWNCRLDTLQAAILRVKLKYITQWNDARRMRAARYDRLFTARRFN